MPFLIVRIKFYIITTTSFQKVCRVKSELTSEKKLASILISINYQKFYL